MALNEKNTPVGLDLEMHKIQTLVYTYLTTNSCVKGDYSNYESYNRVYKNETKDGVVAETFLTGNDYKDVFLNDNVGVSSFFIANDDEDYITPTRKQRTISLIFQINLSKVYPNIPHRADEEFHNEVSNALAGLKKPSIKLGAKVGINNVYSEFEVQKLKDKFHDMQPYHVFRQDFEVQYDYDCCPVFATSGPTCSFVLSVSTTAATTFGGSDGTATANVTGTVNGTLTYLWDDPSAQTTVEATGLVAGNYEVEVTDSIPDSCVKVASDEVEDGAPVGDPDANAYIAIEAVTDETEKTAINTCTLSLKAAGLFNGIHVLNLHMGTSHVYNLRDTLLHQGTIVGGLTITSTGTLGNGTNGYIDYDFNPSVTANIDSFTIGHYSRTNNPSALVIDAGVRMGSDFAVSMILADDIYTIINSNSSTQAAISDANKMIITTRTSSIVTKSYRDGFEVNSSTMASTNRPNGNVFEFARNNNGSDNSHSDREHSVFVLAEGWSGADVSSFTSIMNTFLTTVGRNV